MAYLRHWFNGQALSIYPLRDGLTIGRHPDCDIHVDDPTVSSRHARLCLGPAGYVVEDLGSTNGISVAGEKLDRCALAEAATFRLGTQEFEFLQELPGNLSKTLKIKKSWIPGIYFAKQ